MVSSIAGRWTDEASYRYTQQHHGWSLAFLYVLGLPEDDPEITYNTTRSMTTGIPLQRGSGASQRKRSFGMWPPNDVEKLPCNEGPQLGRVQRKMQGRRKDIRKLTKKWQKMKLDAWALCRKIGGRTRNSCGGPSRRSVQRELSLCRLFARSFSLEDYIWWVSMGHGDSNNRKKKHCNWWCAACGGRYEWRAPNRILVVQLGTNAHEAKVFKAHAAPQGLCETLMNALKLLANQQTDGDSPIQSIVTGVKEKKQQRHHGRVEKFDRNGQPQCV